MSFHKGANLAKKRKRKRIRKRPMKKRKPRKLSRKKRARKKRMPKKARIRQETFLLDYPKPEHRIAIQKEPLQKPLDIPKPSAIGRIEKKKRVPRAATALLGAALVTIGTVSALIYVLGIDTFLSAGLAIPLFAGFSILFYNLLETAQG